MKPYFYKLKHKITGQYYVGSQYGKSADPSNLFKTYFTSSKIVHDLGYENFEIFEIKEREDARQYEAKYLKKAFSLLGKRFSDILLNRNIAPGIIMTPEMIAEANKKRAVSNSVAAKKLLEEGRHNFSPNKRKPMSEKTRKMHSDRMKGNSLFGGKTLSAESRAKVAQAAKGNTNVRGTIWVINDEGKRKRVDPNNIPEGYYKGTKPI